MAEYFRMSDAVLWYDRGSNTGHTVKIVQLPEKEIPVFFALDKHTTVFQSEVYAITAVQIQMCQGVRSKIHI